jgi:hypothetical protein
MYDTRTGVWLSEDPSGFEAADTNLRRYVGNRPIHLTDSTGLAADEAREVVSVPIIFIDLTKDGVKQEDVNTIIDKANGLLSQADIKAILQGIMRPKLDEIKKAIGDNFKLDYENSFFATNPGKLPPECERMRKIVPEKPKAIVVFLVDDISESRKGDFPKTPFGTTFPEGKFKGANFVVIAIGRKGADFGETLVHELIHLVGNPNHERGTITGPGRLENGRLICDRVISPKQQDELREGLPKLFK